MHARKPRERLLGPALRAQPDRRLVALARDGSEPAQEELVRRYRAALVAYAGSIVGVAAAEDVVQEALAKGMAALGRTDGELRLRPWLYAIVRNTALNHLRDAGPATELLDESYDGVEQPPQALERRERLRSLVGGVRRLPEQQRLALVKRELEGRSHEEIGAALGVSSGAARQLIFRARESLRVGFGSLLPMPLLRWLTEGGGDGAVGVTAGAGGGALAAKAAVAVLAAGAAVTAGVAIDNGERGRPATPPAAEAEVGPALQVPAPGSGPVAAPRVEPVAAIPASGPAQAAAHEEDSGHGGGPSSGPGPDAEQVVEAGGRDDGEHSGPGRGRGSDEGSVEDSGPSGPGRSGRGGGWSGGDGGATRSRDDGNGHGEESWSGGGEDSPAAPETVPTTSPEAGGGSGSSGSYGGGEESSPEPLRDLSGSAVSQGADGTN